MTARGAGSCRQSLRKVTMHVCPMCGYNPNTKRSQRQQLDSLFGQRGKRLKKVLRAVDEQMRINVPSDSKLDKKLQFMYKISKFDDAIVIKAIDNYLNSKARFQGKGYAYLAAIVKNLGTNASVIKRNERARYGIPPPVKEIQIGNTSD